MTRIWMYKLEPGMSNPLDGYREVPEKEVEDWCMRGYEIKVPSNAEMHLLRPDPPEPPPRRRAPRMTDEDREKVVHLYDVEELNFNQIAEVLGRTPSTCIKAYRDVKNVLDLPPRRSTRKPLSNEVEIEMAKTKVRAELSEEMETNAAKAALFDTIYKMMKKHMGEN